MARLPFESEYLYGLHDPGGEHLMAEAGRRGWILFTEEVGHDPAASRRSDRYADLASRGFGIIVRLNNGYYNAGTLPHSSQYGNFARCCANFVANSPGAHIWVIGNETNLAAERPGVELEGWRGEARSARDFRDLLSVFADKSRGEGDILTPGETITPEMYVRCYTLCRNAIRSLPGRGQDLVVVGAVAPWNVNSGDWIGYFRRILELLGPAGCDGISLHTYTHGVNPDLVHSTEKMRSEGYTDRYFEFRAYQDFMHAVPANMRHLPVYITETDQNDAWDLNTREWVQRAYGEINHWNQQPGNQQIRALILYRWPRLGNHKWWIDGNQSVVDDFRTAMAHGYRWKTDAGQGPAPISSGFQPGQAAAVASTANLRRTPGHVGKPGDDVLASLEAGAAVTVLGASQAVDGLTWWPVRTTLGDGRTVDGWVAHRSSGGTALLATV
jgi:hypothetical protein